MKSILTKSVSSFLIRRLSSFTYLNFTQFLVALIDNIYKFLIVYFLISIQGIESTHKIMAFTGATFVLPFLLFSATSGTLADRFSKRNVIIFAKSFEFLVMVVGIACFYFESVIGSYILLFLLATTSALFGPSKYGILPELVSTDKISKANGLMTSFTFLAIILGTFLASFVLDYTDKNFILAASACACISLVGLLASTCIEYTPPSGSRKKFKLFFLREIFHSLTLASHDPSLLMAVLGSSFFLFLGAFVQLNIIPFAMQSLHLTDIQGGYLFLIMAIGIGTGALLAGKLSGKIVELGLVPVAGLMVAVCCYLTDLFSDHIQTVIPLLMLLGLFGGMYQIPLDSFIQVTSPHRNRGQIIAATNFLSFFGVLCASIMVYLITEVFGFNADKGFTIIGSLTLGVTAVITFQYFDYLTRFVAMILSKLHFRTTFKGKEQIPDGPALYVCYHQAWNETLILLGSQRRRIRFFIEDEKDHTKWLKRLYLLLRVVLIPAPEPLENNALCLSAIRKTLDKGISVCVFVNNSDVQEEIEKLKHSYSFREILKGTDYPMIPVIIEKGEKQKKPRIFKRILNRFRVPAEISFGDPDLPSSERIALATDS
jgi:acyl-[acyl-carrier-protein]-phospholipid O-acyltransferase / long-chain-fatty-acid--[acyl-carrier-protein] ligase